MSLPVRRTSPASCRYIPEPDTTAAATNSSTDVRDSASIFTNSFVMAVTLSDDLRLLFRLRRFRGSIRYNAGEISNPSPGSAGIPAGLFPNPRAGEDAGAPRMSTGLGTAADDPLLRCTRDCDAICTSL